MVCSKGQEAYRGVDMEGFCEAFERLIKFPEDRQAGVLRAAYVLIDAPMKLHPTPSVRMR
jgi:hypothetical protein